ncbi:MAG: hypothetical protein QMD53_04515 [Actinomycetota bacterium]|nr:hypothetical protein [Actinomycetota bacterium]
MSYHSIESATLLRNSIKFISGGAKNLSGGVIVPTPKKKVALRINKKRTREATVKTA